MTTLTGAGMSIDMRDVNIGGNGIIESDITTLSDTQFTVDSVDGFSFVYTGTGFADNDADDIPDTGTMTGTVISFEGDPLVNLSDFSMTWEDYWAFVTAADDQAWLDAMFSGNDTMNGSSANDYLLGNDGNDTMDGGGGKDTLVGGKGKDTIDGGGSRDKLSGGAQQDTLTGGGSADTFIFSKARDTAAGANKHDIVTDYSSGQGDVIDLAKMNDGSFHLGGTAFTNSVGEIIVFDGVGATVVQGDTDGDGDADFEIYLTNSPPTGEVSILL